MFAKIAEIRTVFARTDRRGHRTRTPVADFEAVQRLGPALRRRARPERSHICVAIHANTLANLHTKDHHIARRFVDSEEARDVCAFREHLAESFALREARFSFNALPASEHPDFANSRCPRIRGGQSWPAAPLRGTGCESAEDCSPEGFGGCRCSAADGDSGTTGGGLFLIAVALGVVALRRRHRAVSTNRL